MDTEEEVQRLEEVEDLSDVDVGLSDSSISQIVAKERFDLACYHQLLKTRQANTRASINANQAVGNNEGAKQYENLLKNVDLELAHCLRSIKTIDREYPQAKGEMQRQFQGGRNAVK